MDEDREARGSVRSTGRPLRMTLASGVGGLIPIVGSSTAFRAFPIFVLSGILGCWVQERRLSRLDEDWC